MAVRARLVPPPPKRESWPWHQAKTASLPVSILLGGDRRMEAENYLGTGYGTRLAIHSLKTGWCDLKTVARVWQPSRLKGIQVSPSYGTPFLAATQVFDLRPVPRKWLALEKTEHAADRFVQHGTILVTCSGNVGRATLAHDHIAGLLISHDLLRVQALQDNWTGWVYAYLRAPRVRAMMKAAQYGHIIKHLETAHLVALPIVKVRASIRADFNTKTKAILELRDKAFALASEAESGYGELVGIPGKTKQPLSGFTTSVRDMLGPRRRIEAHAHNPVARTIAKAIERAANSTEPLGSVVDRIFVPGRFKHVYGPEGTPYLDSAEILEISPDVEKHVLSLNDAEREEYLVKGGWLIVPCSGQLHGIVGSVVLSTAWHENKVLSNHIMRVVPKVGSTIRMGFLQCVLGHPQLGRPLMQRYAFGSSVPELAPDDIATIRIPRFDKKIENRLADAMEECARLRGEADQLEEAMALRADALLAAFLAGDHSMLGAD